MTKNLNEIFIGGDLRLENLKLPNGNTYILGVNLEELETVYETLDENITAVNDDVEELKDSEIVISASLNDLNTKILNLIQENEALKAELADLKDLLQRRYMSYYEPDETKHIIENNLYTE